MIVRWEADTPGIGEITPGDPKEGGGWSRGRLGDSMMYLSVDFVTVLGSERVSRAGLHTALTNAVVPETLVLFEVSPRG